MTVIQMRRLLLGVCVSVLLPCVARAEWGFDTTAAFAYDDNASNAIEAEDRKADSALTLNVNGGISQQLSASTRVTLSAVAEPVVSLRYSGLSNLGLGALAQVRHKFGLGSEAPWAAVTGQAIYRNFNYDYRDGWQYDAAATLGKQLGERWSVSASARYDSFAATHLQPTVRPGISTAAYNVSGWSLGAQAALLITEADLLSASYAWRDGTVTSVTPPDYEVLEYSSAVARDTVFRSNPPLIAYRIRAKTDILGLTWSRSLGRRAAVNVAYAFSRSRTDSELGDYYSNLIALSVSYSQ